MKKIQTQDISGKQVDLTIASNGTQMRRSHKKVTSERKKLNVYVKLCFFCYSAASIDLQSSRYVLMLMRNGQPDLIILESSSY